MSRIEQDLLIEQRAANDAKKAFMAYLLLFFLWGFGVHRIYLGFWMSGLLMMCLWSLGWVLMFVLIGWPILILVSLWVVMDIFLIPGMVRKQNDRLRRELRAYS